MILVMTPPDHTGPSLLSRPMAGLLRRRAFARAPIVLFRLHLGVLLGPRMLLLEHVGRRSGRPRSAALEVLERPDRHRLLIASGFGTKSQWYRNLRATPRCRVSTGLTYRRPATARTLPTEDAAAVLKRYRTAHPASYRALSGVVGDLTGGSIDDVPVVELTLDTV